VSAITIAFSLAGQIGVGVQEAFQLLENAAGILYAFTYLWLFAIPLFGAANLQRKPPLWLRIASASGFVNGSALLDAIGVSDHRGGELAGIRTEDHHGDHVANVIGVGIYFASRDRTADDRKLTVR